MLKGTDLYRHVVLVGSSSEIGIAILSKLHYSDNAEVTVIGKKAPKEINFEGAKVKVEFFECNLEIFEELQKLDFKLSTLPNIDLAIIAAGYLPPENQELNVQIVHKTMMINTVGVVSALSSLVSRMHHQNYGIILYLSTVAAVRPRSRNFTYGSSKSAADFYAQGLAFKYKSAGLKIKILRPGFIFTKMTENFKPAPFALSKEELARIAIELIKAKRQTGYAPKILQYIFLILRRLPLIIYGKL